VDPKTLIIYPKSSDSHVTFSVRIQRELQDQLQKVVDQSGRSKNEVVGLLLQYALDHCVVEKRDRANACCAQR